MAKKSLKLALIAGGPSLERGISLNSARSVLDHLESDSVEIKAFYLDYKKRPYAIFNTQLYCNTPSDFDFKLKQTSVALSQDQFIQRLKKNDLVFPVMHGAFAEDGVFQSFLEKNRLPFIGSDSGACKTAFDKYKANLFLKNLGFFTFPVQLLKIYQPRENKKKLRQFFRRHNLKRAIVKPASGGSSIGVFSVSNAEEALLKASLIFSKRMDTRAVIEPFIEGVEFTVIILQNALNMPAAILPTEIETDYQKHQIFDFRKKYLPTRQVAYHCPPRFDNFTIEKIQLGAEQIFTALGMRDFGRFDGWVLKDGQIAFTDFNPLSGMEQNSFLFQQASRIGLSHKAVLEHILKTACRRYKIKLPQGLLNPGGSLQNSLRPKTSAKKPVHVLFGGGTSERQVSVMSGTNVWLKLRNSAKYSPRPFLLAPDSAVWSLPYHLTLNHTAEEILENCKNAEKNRQKLKELEDKVKLKLMLDAGSFSLAREELLPKKMSLQEFIARSEFVFIGLHGGMGENGELQKLLKQAGVSFNGPCEKLSALCIDKWQTGQAVAKLNLKNICPIPAKAMEVKNLASLSSSEYQKLYHSLLQELKAKALIAKPRFDGCSSGVVLLKCAADLEKYIKCILTGVSYLEKNTFAGQKNRIEMPLQPVQWLVFEKHMQTDILRVKNNRLKHLSKTSLIEITAAAVKRQNEIHVFNPSIAIAENAVLSVEEKFQGGTGINITPPPLSIVSANILKQAKKNLKKLAEKLGLEGYARIDSFLNLKTAKLWIIEINTLPALTPSTVLYHQALAEKKPIHPRALIEELIANKGY